MINYFIFLSFLAFFAGSDIKRREVDNLPILFFYLFVLITTMINRGSVQDNLLLYFLPIMPAIFCLFFVYQKGIIGGADFKILIGVLFYLPIIFFLIVAISGLFALVYMTAARTALNRYLEIERGIPYCICLLFSCIILITQFFMM